MRGVKLGSITLLLLGSIGNAGEKDAPREPSPVLWLASASKHDGNVVIQIAKPIDQSASRGPPNLGPGIRSLPPPPVMKWRNLEKVILGKTVRVFRVNGKPAEPDYVLKALAKPRGVAIFVRTEGWDAPDPFHPVLVVSHAAINPVKEP